MESDETPSCHATTCSLCNLQSSSSLEDDRAMQYLIEEIREEGSSRVSRKGKVLMALLSPEFEQWKKEYDTCGIVRMSRANPEACEYLDILHLKWKAIDPPIEEQPHEA
jgi:hypothetical protein